MVLVASVVDRGADVIAAKIELGQHGIGRQRVRELGRARVADDVDELELGPAACKPWSDPSEQDRASNPPRCTHPLGTLR